MSKRALKRIYKEVSTSDSDYVEITSINFINNQTSKWTREDQKSLRIFYCNALDIRDLLPISDELGKACHLVLKDWNKNVFKNADDAKMLRDEDGHARPSKVITIIRKIKNVLANEDSSSIRESKVDSFMMSLLDYLGFDEEPFLMHPQYDYSATIGDHKISSKVEYMITKKDMYMALIVEDKHPKGTSELSDWSEQQIAGELFCSVYHNVDIASKHPDMKVKFPLVVYAVRVIGTEFTFYKAEATRSYLEECSSNLPLKNGLTIKRYPEQTEADDEYIRSLNAWDFCKQEHRVFILKTLQSFHGL